jgi:large conductance mechanosensitive channel
MGIVKEFKEFAIKGNMVDIAVGLIIGAAFAKIIDSLVKDIFMPPLGFLIGKSDFDKFKIFLAHEQKDVAGNVIQEAVSINYGNLIQVSINFLIIAFVVFMFIRTMNSLKRKSEEQQSVIPPAKDIELLTEIRDILNKK